MEGNFFVDSSCIDCDTCRWLAPETFARHGAQSAVHTQPESHAGRLRAAGAAVACPTGSIRTVAPVPEAKDAAQSMFPLPVNEDKTVFYMGFTSEKTFAASSWLVITEETACLIDCPRFNSKLARRVDALLSEMGRPGGSLDFIVLTHKDDVAGHSEWAKRYPSAKRVIHALEANKRQGTDACEMKLSLAPNASNFELAPGLEIIPVPGHSSGHIAIIHAESQSLFTGDHLAWSSRTGGLSGFPRYNSFSWAVQIENIAKLADLPWLHLYPGHGRMTHFADGAERHEKIMAAVAEMKGN